MNNKTNQEPPNTTPNNVLNIALIGDSKSGKTSLVECYLNKTFDENYTETIVSVHKTKIKLESHSLILNILYFIVKKRSWREYK